MTVIRAGRDSDADGFIALIGACWSEYPGVVLDVDGEVPELRTLASHYAKKGGALWAVEAGGAIGGMIAAYPNGALWEISRLYVGPEARGSGLGHELLDCAELYAKQRGAERLELWSDTRFERAHRFYEKRGYVRAGPIRELYDVSNSIEFHYAKPVDGVERLDAAGVASAEHRLGEILVACVESGASVSFLPPFELDEARAFWRDGTLAGCVMLDLAMPPNQPHRAEVQKLLVDPSMRRRRLARKLMEELEQEASGEGRWLLTLDTWAGGAADMLYRTSGWMEAGRIPQFALNARREAGEPVIFYKRLPVNDLPQAQ